MKASEVDVTTIKHYCNIDHNQDDGLIQSILSGAKAFIQGYSGLSSAEVDVHEDITIALFVICAEMYDNRSFTVNHHMVNPVVKTILQMHARNNL